MDDEMLFEVDGPADYEEPFEDELIPVEEDDESEDPGGQPAAAAPSEDVAALRQELAVLQQRLNDTQANFHRENQGRQLYEAMVQAHRDTALSEQERQRAMAALTPPEPSEDEREGLVSDPDAIMNFVRRNGEYIRQRTLAEVGPHLAEARAVTGLVNTMLPRAVIGAEQDARSIVANSFGIDDREFTRLAPIADGLLRNASPDAATYYRMRLDPNAVATAISVARTREGGVPVNPSPRAPSLSGGGGRGRGRQPIPARLSGTAAKMERLLGLGTGELRTQPSANNRQNGRL